MFRFTVQDGTFFYQRPNLMPDRCVGIVWQTDCYTLKNDVNDSFFLSMTDVLFNSHKPVSPLCVAMLVNCH